MTAPFYYMTCAPATIPATVPPQASAVGYTTQTYGNSGLSLGNNMFLFNTLGTTPVAGSAVQNANGSISMGGSFPSGPSFPAPGNNYSATICTIHQVGASLKGIAFGGGMYVEWSAAWIPGAYAPGFPALWADSLLLLNQNWPVPSLKHWIEVDFMQAPNGASGYWNCAATPVDWSEATGSGALAVSASAAQSQVNLPQGGSFPVFNTYGWLWVLATPTTYGYTQCYFNNAAVGPLCQYSAYKSAYPGVQPFTPPTLSGNTFPPTCSYAAAQYCTFSYLDQMQLALIAGTNTASPMVVNWCNVWQGSGANNYVA